VLTTTKHTGVAIISIIIGIVIDLRSFGASLTGLLGKSLHWLLWRDGWL
jgi:hypothetical protein